MKGTFRLILSLVVLLLSSRVIVRDLNKSDKESRAGVHHIKIEQSQLFFKKINGRAPQNTAKNYIVIQVTGSSEENIVSESLTCASLDHTIEHFFKDLFFPRMNSLNIFFGEKVFLLTRDEVGIWSTCGKNRSKDNLHLLKSFDIQTLFLNLSLIETSNFADNIVFPDTRLPEDIYFEVNGKDRYLLRNVSGQNELFFQGKDFKILLKNDVYAKIKGLLSTF